MLTAPLHHPTVADHLQSSMLRDCTSVVASHAETPDLVEWEMSAAQVGSLVAAMALIFGIVSLLT